MFLFLIFQIDFPANKGLEIGESSFFRCDHRHAMPPVDDSKWSRKEVRIFCQKVFDSELGVRIEYRLQTGVKIPPCEFDSKILQEKA
jgi:hypothetical protein